MGDTTRVDDFPDSDDHRRVDQIFGNTDLRSSQRRQGISTNIKGHASGWLDKQCTGTSSSSGGGECLEWIRRKHEFHINAIIGQFTLPNVETLERDLSIFYHSIQTNLGVSDCVQSRMSNCHVGGRLQLIQFLKYLGNLAKAFCPAFLCFPSIPLRIPTRNFKINSSLSIFRVGKSRDTSRCSRIQLSILQMGSIDFQSIAEVA